MLWCLCTSSYTPSKCTIDQKTNTVMMCGWMGIKSVCVFRFDIPTESIPVPIEQCQIDQCPDIDQCEDALLCYHPHKDLCRVHFRPPKPVVHSFQIDPVCFKKFKCIVSGHGHRYHVLIFSDGTALVRFVNDVVYAEALAHTFEAHQPGRRTKAAPRETEYVEF